MRSSQWLVLVSVLSGCGSRDTPVPEQPPTSAPAPAPIPEALLGVWEGTLPCADCAGVATKLTLFTEDAPGKLATSYKMTQTRAGGAPEESAGAWIVLRGSAADPDATVWELDPEDPDTSRAFLRVSETELRLLDRDYAELPSGPATLARTFPAPLVEVGEADAGRAIELTTGQSLVVRLPGNRSTGFSWAFVPVSDPILLAEHAEYHLDPHDPGVVGTGGTEMLQFAAWKAGHQTLTLQYKRPFEKDTPPAREITYDVTVK